MAERSSLSPDVAHEALAAAPLRPQIERGRLGVYSALGASMGAVPLPWVPDALVRRVRGALVQDVVSRHGLSLTRDARDVLAEPSGPDGPRGILAQVTRYLGSRLALRLLTGFGPLGLVWPMRNGLQTYVLGHLFDRYLDLGRTQRGVRIEVEEARRVRQAVDGALARAITVRTESREEPTAIDDHRDAATALVDGVLSAVAGVPERMMGRLDAAFDDLLAHADG